MQIFASDLDNRCFNCVVNFRSEDREEWNREFLLKVIRLTSKAKDVKDASSFFKNAHKFSTIENAQLSLKDLSSPSKHATRKDTTPPVDSVSLSVPHSPEQSDRGYEERQTLTPVKVDHLFSTSSESDSEESQSRPNENNDSSGFSGKRRRSPNSAPRGRSLEKRARTHKRSLFSSSSSERSPSKNTEPFFNEDSGDESNFQESEVEEDDQSGVSLIPQEGENLADSSGTSLEEGVYKADCDFTRHVGPWYKLNEAVARLDYHPNLGEVIHFKKYYIPSTHFHKTNGPHGWLISPKGELGMNSSLMKSLIANCLPYELAERAKEITRRDAIATDVLGFLQESEYFSKNLDWKKISGKDEVKISKSPDWLLEYSREDFKLRNLSPTPAWKFIGDGDCAPVLETLSFKMEEDFTKEGSKLGGARGVVPKKVSENLEELRKSASSSSRSLMILDGLKKLLNLASASELDPCAYKALFRRASTLTDELTRFIEPKVKTDVSAFAQKRREVRKIYVGNMKPSSLRYYKSFSFFPPYCNKIYSHKLISFG